MSFLKKLKLHKMRTKVFQRIIVRSRRSKTREEVLSVQGWEIMRVLYNSYAVQRDLETEAGP